MRKYYENISGVATSCASKSVFNADLHLLERRLSPELSQRRTVSSTLIRGRAAGCLTCKAEGFNGYVGDGLVFNVRVRIGFNDAAAHYTGRHDEGVRGMLDGEGGVVRMHSAFRRWYASPGLILQNDAVITTFG